MSPTALRPSYDGRAAIRRPMYYPGDQNMSATTYDQRRPWLHIGLRPTKDNRRSPKTSTIVARFLNMFKNLSATHDHIIAQSDERLRLPTTCDYLRPAVIVGSRSGFYHNRTSSHTLRSLYDRSSMIVEFWSLSRMQVADCCTTIVR